MAIEKPYEGRAKVEDTLRAINIEIPVKRNMFVFLFLSFWLCAWLFGELMVLVMLLATVMHVSIDGIENVGLLSFDFLFLSIWFLGWTVGGLFALKNWLWLFKGKEIIQLDREELSIDTKFSMFSPKKSYYTKEIKNLQINQQSNSFPFFGAVSNLSMIGSKNFGAIKFDYGFKTIHFAAGLDEAEARYILEKINNKGFIKEK